jgi:hypothetical protein
VVGEQLQGVQSPSQKGECRENFVARCAQTTNLTRHQRYCLEGQGKLKKEISGVRAMERFKERNP